MRNNRKLEIFFFGMIRILGMLCLAGSLGAAALCGQVLHPTATPLPVPALALPDNIQPDLVAPAAPDTYIIGPDDLLTVFVYQMPELTRQVRVSAHGNIRLPFVRQSFHAAGLTAPQLQRSITRALLSDGLARAPMVQVVVRQVESKPIVVAGAVARPNTLQAARPMPLLEVLARAGGITSDAGDTVLVTQRNLASAAGPSLARQYNLMQLMRFNNPADDPMLIGNELVTVLPARRVYVVGSFLRPGAFPLQMGEPITVIRAIALARGFKGMANRGNSVIIRTLPDGRHTEIRLHINKILHHKAPDPVLHSGDILYVPKDRKRQILMTALADTAQIVTLGVAYHFP